MSDKLTQIFKSRLYIVLIISVSCISTGMAQNNAPPYDEKMQELAQILGSLHYLSGLCGDKSGIWREQMSALLQAEKADEPRKKRLISHFNTSYRSYSENYSRCTDQALRAIEKYKSEGEKLSSGLITRYGN